MLKIKVINVGQGDCITLSPGDECRYAKNELFVDVGPGRRRVYDDRDRGRQPIVVLSHSHADHIEGLRAIYSGGGPITELWVPLFFSEVVELTHAISQMRGIDQIPGDLPALLSAKYAVTSAELLKELARVAGTSVRLCYEGAPLCDHLTCLNPPRQAEDLLHISSARIDQFRASLRETGYSQIRDWFSPDAAARLMGTISGEFEMERLGEGVDEEAEALDEQRRRLVLAYLLRLQKSVGAFVERPSAGQFTRIYRGIRALANNASIVLAYSRQESDPSANEPAEILLTGDAERPAFRRLMSKPAGDPLRLPRAKVLKVPHHGSRGATDCALLAWVDPEVCIVSHENGRFGRDKDTHPHLEVVRALGDSGAAVLYTNHVRKGGTIVELAAVGGSFWTDPAVQFLD